MPLTYLLFISIALVILVPLVIKYHHSLVGNFLTYLLTGTFLLGFIRLFFYLVENKYLALDEITVMMGWHLMFYNVSTILLIATSELSKTVDISKSSVLNNKTILYSLVAVFIAFSILISTPFMDKYVSPIFENSFWDKLGTAHFIAFIYAGYISKYLFTIRSKFSGSLGSVAMPLFISMLLLSVMHLIELFSESWKVIPLGETGELLEEIIWIPTYLCLAIGAWKLKKALG